MMLIALHVLAYVVFAVGFSLFLLYRAKVDGSLSVGCRGLSYGLLASPLGLFLPYAFFFGLGALYYGESPPHVPSLAGPLDLLFTLTLLFGPFVGPSVTALFVYRWYVRRHQTTTRSSELPSQGRR